MNHFSEILPGGIAIQQIKSFILSFSMAFFCLSLMVMATVLWVTPYSRPQETPAQSYIFLPKEEDTLTILVVHEEQMVKNFSIISVQPQQGRILLKTFPPASVINGENLARLWEQEGSGAVASRLGDYLDLSIQRTAVVTDRNLIELCRLFGPVPVSLTESLSYTESDLKVTLEPGLHKLNGEQILHYLDSTENSVEYSHRSGQLLQTAINQSISLAATEQAQEIFTLLLDCMDSDLSLADYDRCHSAMAFMAELVDAPAVLQ